ncbi:MAG: phosphatase PAP2 family protein [Actinomycetota bacterium]|jgi:vanadium chloroperoxidase|nr:phosphatase PAP2 family protein [Actinomycetota bacterium]
MARAEWPRPEFWTGKFWRGAAIQVDDQILYWNAVALEANRVSHTNGAGEQTGPPLSSRALAIVHLAMYDAYAGASGNPANLPKYLPNLPAAANASADAAVAAAAHATLSALFPSQGAAFDLALMGADLPGGGVDEGRAFGLLVAKEILKDRGGDPGVGHAGYSPSSTRTAHRPDPDDPEQGYHAPYYGAASKCFAVTKRHKLDDPPRPGNVKYRNALREVRGKGIAPELMGTLPQNASRRSAKETIIGVYWGYDGSSGLGTPPRLYNQIAREVAAAKMNTPEDNARLFALVNVAMADAGILAWEQKYVHDLWRPVLGVREHDPSMGPFGEPGSEIHQNSDPSWLPLGAPNTNAKPKDGVQPKNITPPFPAYPSGHATFGAAAFHITRLFYGSDGINKGGVPKGNRGPDTLFDGLSFVSDEFDGVNRDNKGTVRPRHEREFDGGLWKMIEENGLSRVYLGVHWSFDAFAIGANGKPDFGQDIGGAPLGVEIAEDVFSTGMKKSPAGPKP